MSPCPFETPRHGQSRSENAHIPLVWAAVAFAGPVLVVAPTVVAMVLKRSMHEKERRQCPPDRL